MRVVVSLRARSDILDIYSFLSERSPAVAERMLSRLSERFDELREFPISARIEASFELRCVGY